MSVFGALSSLKNHVNFKVSYDSPAIDNIIFKLHYRATFAILLTATILVASREFYGGHIDCIHDGGVPHQVINTFCFFSATFTVVKHMNETEVNEHSIPHPGVGPHTKHDEIKRHAYYQWVPFVLFFQAILFYLPHLIWRHCEGGRLRALLSGLHNASFALNDEKVVASNGIVVMSKKEREAKIQTIRRAFMERLHINRQWAYYLGLCEILNFLNVGLQFYITQWFLGGSFFHLGKKIWEGEFGKDYTISVFDEIFPKVTKCTFHKIGPSGGMQKHDAMCVMALNIINEKIYAFLYFWFIFLLAMTLIGLLYRILTLFCHARFDAFNELVFKMACPGKHNPWKLLSVTKDSHFGDWLFLYYMAKNMDNYIFSVLLEEIAHDLGKRTIGFKYQPAIDMGDLPEKEPLNSKR